jgi:hypothetical protein
MAKAPDGDKKPGRTLNVDLSQVTSDLTSQMSRTKKHHHKHHHHSEEHASSKPAPLSAASFLAPSSSATSARHLDQYNVAATYHLSRILSFLARRSEEGKPFVSEEEIENEFGISIQDIPRLASSLRGNPQIQYEDDRYSWRSSLDRSITDRNELIDVLREVRFVKSSDLKGSYKGYEKDLKELKESGELGEFSSSAPKEKLYFAYDVELLKLKTDPEFREAWKHTQIPASRVEREGRLMAFGAQPLKVVEPFHRDDGFGSDMAKRKRRPGQKKFHNQFLLDAADQE